MTTTTDYLATYLQDHYAGSTAGLELAKRIASENEGEPLGAHLEQLAREIEQDRDILRELMEQLEVSASHTKDAAAWVGEKLSRLKPNDELLHYSPLSRYEELEALSLGIEGKRLLWLAIAAAKVDGTDQAALPELAASAERQRAALEPFRIAAARATFA